MQVLFEDADVTVLWRERKLTDVVAVTFSTWTSTLPKPLWATETSHCNGIYFIAHRNHWFQVDGMKDAIATIVDRIAGRRVVALGSSMGGFAAIAYADDLGAERTVAVSPQYSILKRHAPFEHRWQSDAQAIRAWPKVIGASERPTHVVLDPRHPDDSRQAELILKSRPSTRLWPMEFSGHPSTFALSDLGFVSDLIKIALSEHADDDLFVDMCRKYVESASISVNVALNDARYGEKRYLRATEEELNALQGPEWLRDQLKALRSA